MVHYQIGLVLDDCAQPQADVSVLSTVKVRQAKLWRSGG